MIKQEIDKTVKEPLRAIEFMEDVFSEEPGPVSSTTHPLRERKNSTSFSSSDKTSFSVAKFGIRDQQETSSTSSSLLANTQKTPWPQR